MNLDLSVFFSLYQLYNQDLFETYPKTYPIAGHDWCHLSHLLMLHSHSRPLSMSPQPQVMPWNLRSANAHTVLELQIQWKLCSITHKSWKDVLFFYAILCFMNVKVLPCTQCLTECIEWNRVLEVCLQTCLNSSSKYNLAVSWYLFHILSMASRFQKLIIYYCSNYTNILHIQEHMAVNFLRSLSKCKALII